MNIIVSFWNIVKSFFFSRGKFSPVYFWSTVLTGIIVSALVMKLTAVGAERISDTLIGILMGYISLLLGIHSYARRNGDAGIPPGAMESRLPPTIGPIPPVVGDVIDKAKDLLKKKGGK